MDRYMKYSIVYSSRTGNTKMLAETIYKVIPHEAVVYYGPDDLKALNADRIYIGFWTNNGICDDNTKKFISHLTNQEVFLFGTAGLGGSANYFDKIIQRTRKLLPEKVKFFASYMCQGKMPVEVRNRYIEMKKLYSGLQGNPSVQSVQGGQSVQNEQSGQNVQKIQNVQNIQNIDRLIKNFDNAQGHPSKEDLRKFSNWLKEMV